MKSKWIVYEDLGFKPDGTNWFKMYEKRYNTSEQANEAVNRYNSLSDGKNNFFYGEVFVKGKDIVAQV